MNPKTAGLSRLLLAACCSLLCAGAHAAEGWQAQHDALVARLRALRPKAGDFGPAYEPIYRAALGWYESWGGRNDKKVDDNMVSPEQYASELADALEHGRNYIAENPGSNWPLMFEGKLPDGRVVTCNYWLILPKGFPAQGKSYPLDVGLHGSGWLAHKISFVRGKGMQGEMFSVVPIDEAGPWQLDFLNTYLDELERILPVDRDRVFLEGHSLGAMATWEWALANPERFAAISPRDGLGEPYRAVRLRNVPAWVVHGEKDDVIYSGYAEQMISAMRSTGGTARYSLLPNAPHNVPADFDQASVVAWYLKQTRSHEAPPADPRDSLGLGDAGFSPWQVIAVPAGSYWRSAPTPAPEKRIITRPAERPLFKKIQSKGLLVGSPVLQLFAPDQRTMTLWLAVPDPLLSGARKDPEFAETAARRAVRFYFRGTYREGLDHAKDIAAAVAATGQAFSGGIWVTPLSLWQNTPKGIAEYRVELK
jgi:pimeloyl-ACP methyl ester carboxylesterase